MRFAEGHSIFEQPGHVKEVTLTNARTHSSSDATIFCELGQMPVIGLSILHDQSFRCMVWRKAAHCSVVDLQGRAVLFKLRPLSTERA